MSLTVSVRTVSGQTSSISVDSTITIAQLRDAITEKCGLGFCTTLVFKGQPLKNGAATLASTNYSEGDQLVGVFKKEAPKPAATPAPVAPVTPVAAPTPSAADLQTPVKAPAPTAAPAAAPVAEDVSIYQLDWECPTCTYINIGARTICEMCMSEDPNKAKLKKPSAQGEQQRRPVNQQQVEEQLKTIQGYDQMDLETQAAVRTMIEDDLAEGGVNPTAMGDGTRQVSLDEYLTMLDSNPDQRKAFCADLGLPETSTNEELSAAIKQRAEQQHQARGMDDGELGADREALLQMMLSDPQMAAQLQTILAENQGADPEQLQAALMELIQNGLMGGDEDDEDVEFDDGEMGDE